MKNQPLISVIVPIYNVEKYLSKCIDSILSQTLTNIEVILVNDGSTDNCGNIIENYKAKDTRVVTIHKKNGGQSSARNMGLDIARGKYIGFVDSDDWIDKDMYENLYKSVQLFNADIGVCGRKAYSVDDRLEMVLEVKDKIFDFNNIDKWDYIIKYLFYKHTVSSCNKIYRADIIYKYNIVFDDVRYVGSEDALFNYKIICHANRITAINKFGYNGLARTGSTTRSYNKGYMQRTSNLINCMDKYSIDSNNEELAKYSLPAFALFFYQWNISQIKTYADEYNHIDSIIIEELNHGMNNKVMKKYTNKLVVGKLGAKCMKSMGFRLSGRTLIRFTMSLCCLGLYKYATQLILLK